MPSHMAAPPFPQDVRTWADFTAALRELYEWCGSPKYRALGGRVHGLSPAAISNLIGRNPVDRPPEAASLRFVEACLRYRGWPGLDEERTRWAECWKRLATAEIGAAPSGGPLWRRPQLVVNLAAVVAALGATGALIAFQTGTQGAICQELTETVINDVRTKRAWRPVYLCSNETGSPLYADARPGRPIGYLDTEKSWFICWTHGELDGSGTDIWYYTQGDRTATRPELEAWGFLPASALRTERHPDPGVLRRCAF